MISLESKEEPRIVSPSRIRFRPGLPSLEASSLAKSWARAACLIVVSIARESSSRIINLARVGDASRSRKLLRS